jgi:hypothetical protein
MPMLSGHAVMLNHAGGASLARRGLGAPWQELSLVSIWWSSWGTTQCDIECTVMPLLCTWQYLSMN